MELNKLIITESYNVVHKLGHICTYSGFVQIQTHNNVSDALKKIFHQNLAKESKIALLSI